MTSRIRRLARFFSCLLMLGMAAYAAEPAKTVVSDTIYRADGSPAAGTMVISWPAFVTADGKPVAAGSKTVKIGANGAISIPLVPTQGATPAGTYYKVVLSLDDGASSQEYWTMPTLSPTSIAAIRSSVVPATVAMQVVSREYVDGAVANTVRKTGDETVSGVKTFDSSPLVPSPSAPTAAANKDYVDVSVAAGSGAGTLALNRGGTGQNSWTPARCVRVANNGTSLESAPADCNVISNADMVDGQHAASFQAAMANAATLSKIAESGGNPLWNGGAWPGGSGGSGNATQIQGKAVDVPDTARQFEVYDGATGFKKWQDPVVRMNRDCGIVGTGDETAALNTCIANLPNYTGVLECDKPGMIIHSTGVVVRDKVGIRIETAGGGHSLNNFCQLIYTGAAAGTLIDAERTRNSVLFKGFQIYAGNADIGFQTGQTGSGSNISTSNSFEEIALNNNNGRSTFIGFMIGDSTNNNSDEMKFNHVSISSSGCTKCGTAFKAVQTNVYGTEFRDIMLSNLAVGFDWTNNASVDKVNATSVALLYKLVGNGATFHVQHEDIEWVDQILQVPSGGGSVTFVEENGRVILNTPPGLEGLGVTGTSGHPAWDNSGGGSLRIRNLNAGGYGRPGLTLLKGSSAGWADVDFYDPGITTYGNGIGGASGNNLNFISNNGFMSGVAGSNSTIWVGRGFLDEKGMMVPGIGMQQTNYGVGLRGDFTPCTRGNVCFNEGQVELTGVHSMFNTPTINYTGTAGSTARYYAVVACDDTSCAPGHRSIPTTAVGKSNTQASLDGSNYVTLTWTPALNVNKYGIFQQHAGSPNEWNLLLSNISCSTNPCTTNITTDSSSYASGYPSDNETGGVILRGAIKLGKSATQPAVLDYTYASATPSSMNQWAQSSWTATSSSTASGTYSAAKGIDGNAGTYWSSDGITTAPWTFDVDMMAPYPTSGLTYVPNSGGRALTYEVYLSSDGTTWGSAVASGAWANDNTTKAATWSPAVYQHVRLKILSNSSAFATVQELNLYSPSQMVAADTVNGKHASDFLAATAQLPLTRSAVSHKWLAGYDATTGTYTQTQPDYSDLTGTPTLATVAATGAYADLTGKPTLATNTAATSHQFFSAYNSTTGAFTKAQPDYSDLTGAPTLAATKTCAGTDKVSAYDASTGVFTCSADQTGTGGSGITSLNGATVTTQTFVDGANIHVSTNTGTGAHTIAVTGLGDAAAKNTGTTTGTVAAGDDSRFTNARTPTAHASTHQNGGSDEIATATAGANAIPKAGAGGTLAVGWIPDLSATYLPLHSTADLAAGLSAQYTDWSASSGGASIKNKPTMGGAAALNVGTTTGTVAAGDDSRLNNARTPTAHASTHQNGGSDEIATATAGANAIPKAGAGGQLAAGWMPALTGDVTTSAGAVATAMRTGLNVRTCELHVWGTSTSSVLQDTDDEVASCLNKYGVTWTITYVGCWANAGSPTVMITKTGGNNVLSGNLTCGTASWASGSLTGTSADKQTADGGTLDVNIVSAGGTATNIRIVIAGTI